MLSRFIAIAPEVKYLFKVRLWYALAIESLKFVPPLIITFVIDYLIAKQVGYIYPLVGLLFVVSLLITKLEGTSLIFYNSEIFQLKGLLLERCQERIMKLGLIYYEKTGAPYNIRLLSELLNRIEGSIWFFFDQFVSGIIQIILTSLVLLYFNSILGLIFVAVLPVVVLMMVVSSYSLQPHREKYSKVFKLLQNRVTESIINYRTVLDFGMENAELEYCRSEARRYAELGSDRIKRETVDISRRDQILSLLRCTLVGFGCYLVVKGDMTTGALVLYSTLSEKVISSLYRIGRMIFYLNDASEAYTALDSLFARACPEVTYDREPSGSTLVVRDVSFDYNSEGDLLREVSFELLENRALGIIGTSGSGKSSLIKLIKRSYRPDSGCITFGNCDIASIKDYERYVACVSQHVELFNDTVFANIAYGYRDFRVEVPGHELVARVHEAAEYAGALEFIDDLPQGFDTLIGDRGLKLSGGQRQRLGIARALMQRPKLLILDEATSNLDSASEEKILESVRLLRNQMSLIIVAHRLTTVMDCDEILVLEGGRIIEQGPLDRLLSSGESEFSKRCRLQRIGNDI